MKSTPFYDKEVAAGAKMVEYAGYEMPVSFTSIREEHLAVRRSLGIFDVSHMGEFVLKGPHALDLIQRLCTNDASKLMEGQAQYSCMTYENGGIVDDLIVYCLEKDQAYMMVVNASNIEKDWDWIVKHNSEDVEMHNISEKTALLAVQGPKAVECVQKIVKADVDKIPFYQFIKTEVLGIPDVLISATGYTGSGGFEIYFEDQEDHAERIWDALMEAGAEYDVQLCGLGSRDTLRLEMGYCLYGNDIDETTSPLEAGLGWITKFTKDFTASELLKNQKTQGVDHKLKGFIMVDKGIPRQGYTIHDAEGTEIGKVTSGTQSPSTGKNIGMGYLRKDMAKLEQEVWINIRNKMMKAVVYKFPFYSHS